MAWMVFLKWFLISLLGPLACFFFDDCLESGSHGPCDIPAACQSAATQVQCTIVRACNTIHTSSVQPVIPHYDPETEEDWWNLHEELKREAHQKGPKTKVVFLGDSITEGYRGTTLGHPVEYFAKIPAVIDKYFGNSSLAFGIAADSTEHLLWRLLDGELGSMQPPVAVVLIGTNNLHDGMMYANNTVLGVAAVAELLLSLLDRTHIFIMGILPRELGSSFKNEIQFVNSNLQPMANHHRSGRLHYLDCGHLFLFPNGTIQPELMPDLLHPADMGVDTMMRNCILPALQPYI